MGRKSFKDVFLKYKNEVEQSDLSADEKSEALNKLVEIENRYFNFRENGIKIIYNNYCFFLRWCFCFSSY